MDDNPVEVLPPVNPVVANKVLAEVDNLINWKNDVSQKIEKAGIRLSRHVADVSQQSYWLVRGYKSEAEYVSKTFPQSNEQYSILRRIGIDLREYPIELLEEIGISKCQDLVRVKRKDGTIDTNWFIWGKTESRDAFRIRVRKYIGKALPPAEFEEDDMLHIRVWKDVKSIVYRALETAMQIANSESRSDVFCNIICPEFLSTYYEHEHGPASENNFHLLMIQRHIQNLKYADDPTIFDRLIGVVRQGIADKKEK